MSRLIPVILGTLLGGSAHAGGYLAGGLMGSPSPAAELAVGAPSFKVGLGSARFAGYGSLHFARATLDAGGGETITVWGAQPALGVRGRLGARADEVVVAPLLSGGAYTRLWGVGSSDPDLEPDEQDPDAALRPVVGGTLGTGLDARMSENLTLSVEVGLDAFTAGYQYGGWVSHFDHFSTWSAVYVNIWL